MPPEEHRKRFGPMPPRHESDGNNDSHMQEEGGDFSSPNTSTGSTHVSGRRREGSSSSSSSCGAFSAEAEDLNLENVYEPPSSTDDANNNVELFSSSSSNSSHKKDYPMTSGKISWDDANFLCSTHTIKVTARFAIVSVILAITFSFGVGRIVSIHFYEFFHGRPGEQNYRFSKRAPLSESLPHEIAFESKSAGTDGENMWLVQRTIKVDAGEALSDEWFGHRCDALGTCNDDDDHEEVDDDEEEDDDDEEDESYSGEDEDEEDEDDEGEVEDQIPYLHYNEPASGQTAFMDFDGVISPALLASENELITAIRVILKQTGDWDALSYHCHTSPRNLVNCVAILSGHGHFAVHASPATGSAFFSLSTFTHGSDSLVQLIRKFRDLFVPVTGDEVTDKLNWSRIKFTWQYRGLNDWSCKSRDPYKEDLGDVYFSNPSVRMSEIASGESTFQRIDIYDVIDPRQLHLESYRRSLSEAGVSYESLHPELFKPNRVVFLDGVVQSSSRGDEAYHEALVHPAMLAHPHPMRVAIIGGGEGATLREVLKHDTVEHVKMIDIDEVMVRMSAEYLPRWSNCSDVQGSHESCFEDDRAEVLYEDAMAWFVNRFNYGTVVTEKTELHGSEDKFDVVIVDALDPQDTVEFANVLYQSDAFIDSLHKGLNENGILAMQLGRMSALEDPPDEMQNSKNRFVLLKMVDQLGFQSMHIYEESHCGFNDPWTFLVACKSIECRKSWYANSAEIERAIHQRIRRTNSGRPSLKYFDGATMESYLVPRKAIETNYCRSYPASSECKHGTEYNKEFSMFSTNDFEIKAVNDSPEYGVFAKVDMPKLSYIETGDVVHFPPFTMELVEASSAVIEVDMMKPLVEFVRLYGLESTIQGPFGWYVDPGVYSVMKHGCNMTSNVGHLASWTYKQSKPLDCFAKREASPSTLKLTFETPESATDHEYSTTPSPVLLRHVTSYAAGYLMTLRDIRKGEEIKTNHLHRRSDGAKWIELVHELDKRCV